MNVPEKELQEWFVNAAQTNNLQEAVQNYDAIQAEYEELLKFRMPTRERDRIGLGNALKVFGSIIAAKFIVADKTVSPLGSNAMRPDLILYTEMANYVLVELKTQSGAERQGVQELLAYSAAIREQAPFLSDVYFVVVANHWNPSLSYAVKALVYDGKPVLPLTWEKKGEGEFQLHINRNVLTFPASPAYDPYYAFTPYFVSANVVGRGHGMYPKPPPEIVSYFRSLSRNVVSYCQRNNQTGFTFFWVHENSYYGTLADYNVILATFTVNQFWLQSEHTPIVHPLQHPELRTGFVNALYDAMSSARKAMGDEKREGFESSLSTTDDDLFDYTGPKINEYFDDGGTSLAAIEGSRNRPHEGRMMERLEGNGFSSEQSYPNLAAFIRAVREQRVWDEENFHGFPSLFYPFGELADFVKSYSNLLEVAGSGPNLRRIIDIVEKFRAWKMRDHPGPIGWSMPE